MLSTGSGCGAGAVSVIMGEKLPHVPLHVTSDLVGEYGFNAGVGLEGPRVGRVAILLSSSGYD